MRCLHQIPSLRAQGAMQKRRQKVWTCQRVWMTPRKQCLPDTSSLMPIWIRTAAAEQGLHRTGPRAEKERQAQAFTPNQDTISNWHSLGKETLACSKEVSLSISAALKSRLHAQKQRAKTKQTLVFFRLFYSHYFVRAFFVCFTGIVPVYYGFQFCIVIDFVFCVCISFYYNYSGLFVCLFVF